jgi:LysR family glycine cleavage system transcriptional activator
MRDRFPPLNALRCFECAGRHMSFALAAEELNVTPGAVRRQIKTLEEWLGAPLFRRRHKQVVLTPLGRSYLAAVGAPLEEIAAATSRARRREGDRPIAISSYPTFALRWLVPRWGHFYNRHPDIDVQLTTSLQPVDFERDEFDAAILVGEGKATWPRLTCRKLVDVELAPVCSPALLKGDKPLREPADLAGFTLLHGSPRPRDWARWLEFAGVSGIDPESGLTFDSLNLALQAAIEGLGVAIAVRALARDDLAAGRLVEPFTVVRRSRRPFHLVYPPGNERDPRLRHFIDWLCEEAAA